MPTKKYTKKNKKTRNRGTRRGGGNNLTPKSSMYNRFKRTVSHFRNPNPEYTMNNNPMTGEPHYGNKPRNSPYLYPNRSIIL